MALLGMNGFEHKSPTARPGSTYSAVPAYPAGRFGGFAMAYGGSSSGSLVVNLTPVTGQFVMGVGIVPTNNASGTWQIQLNGGGSTHLLIAPNANKGIDLWRGNGSTLIASTAATGIVAVGVWIYLEIKALIADSGGTCLIRVNMQEVINYTGDTRNAGSAQVDQFALIHQATSQGETDNFDDLYWLDTTGAAPYNDFLGDVKIETLVPTAPGAVTQFVPSTGANWACVDEQPAVTTDYVGSPTVGNRDTYAHSDLTTSSGQVLAVQPMTYAFASDAGGANMRSIARAASGTVRQGTVAALSPSPTWVMGGFQTTDPDGNPWTIASVNAAEFGVEVA